MRINADWIEIVWTVVTLTGLISSLHNAEESYWDWKAAREHKLAEIQDVGYGNFRRDLLRALSLLCMATTGVFSMFRPAPPGGRPVGSLISIGLLVLAALLITLNSHLDVVLRGKINDYLKVQQKEEERLGGN